MTLAHIQTGSAAIDGFLHPLLSFSYVLATLIIGMLSIRMQGRSLWLVPTLYSVALLIGGGVGLFAPAVDFINLYGFAASVIVLGVVLLAVDPLPDVVTYLVVIVMAVVHGYAHSQSIDTDYQLLILSIFVLGVVISAISLQLIGLLIGFIMLRRDNGQRLLYGVGVVFALLGLLVIIL